jgi:hypothetical protein
VHYKASYFNLVVNWELRSFNALKHYQILLSIQHPNIAATYNVYCYEDRVFVCVEHLNVF